jgi:phosphodiesterase/alkaline phosphatase D-like protein
VRNAVVLTGDVHQHYAADLKADYAACTLTRKQYLAELRTLPYVSTPGAPAQTKAAFVLQDRQPGLQPA